MARTRSSRFAGVIVVAALAAAVAGCGGSTVTGTTSTATPTGSDAPSDQSTASAMVVVRTGGIAGVVDMVRIAADGTADITSKTRESHACTPSAKAVDRLRAVDLAAVAATASQPPRVADAFSYSVKVGDATATASEGDDDSRRAELVDAAAAVVATCLAKQS